MPLSAASGVEGGTGAPLAERASAILRDEIANGALANIAAASQVWSAHRRDLVTPETVRHLASELGGLLDTVLDLLVPPPRSPAAAALTIPATLADLLTARLDRLTDAKVWRSSERPSAGSSHPSC